MDQTEQKKKEDKITLSDLKGEDKLASLDEILEKLQNKEEKGPTLEIERKYKITELPEDYEKYPSKEIIQGYVAIEGDTEKRLRKKGEKYFYTIKKGKGKTRFEAEAEISEDLFNELWSTTEGKRVEKTRYKIPYGKHFIELDEYHGKLQGLYTAEIEFKNEDDSNNFVAPDWFGGEVTEDKGYKNQNLALKGKPEITKK